MGAPFAPRVVFAQLANPGAYPPVLNAAAILATEAGALIRFVGVRTQGTEGMVIPSGLGSEHRLVDLPPPGWRQKVTYLRWLARTVYTALRWRADLVYVSDFYAAPAGVVLGALGVRILYHEHDGPPERSGSAWIRLLVRARRRVGRIAVARVAPGPDRADRLVREVGALGPTFSVMNCPRRAELAPAENRRKAPGTVLHYHGSLGEERLPLSVLEALTLLPADVSLQVVGYETIGSVGYLDQLRHRSTELGVAGRVTLHDAVPRRELFEICRSASIGLMLLAPDTGNYDMATMAGASNKIFDYLACGLPLVVSDAPSLDERAEGFGVVCRDLSAAGIAAAVTFLLQHPNEAEQMRQRGRRRIEEDWNFDTQFRPVLDLLRQEWS